MFARTAVFATLALPLLAAATPVELEARQTCSTGAIQCCSSVESASSASGNFLLGLLGIVLGDITGLIGLNCSPLTIIGVGSGNACSANAVCCTNNNIPRGDTAPESAQKHS
ncbi:fungal hydrophobin-domain-containing protein [Trametes gibbosa]|nr:fungal hydrophobin-domain-containing protein [Trametes gibbosa]